MSPYSDDPAEIQELSSKDFQIRWQGGHVSIYPYTLLREACPCARCEETRRRLGGPGRVREDIHPTAWDRVGRYALNFVWSDAHSSGIYPYKLLRQLCPCPECSA